MNAFRHITYRRAPGALSIAALVCSALTACGSAAGTDPAGGSLCDNVGRVGRLVVKRVDLIPQNHPHFTFPAKVTVSDPVTARSIAHAVCALPAMPRGPMSCGADLGVTYQLSFAADGKQLPLVRAGGVCTEVRGARQTRWTARSPDFWQTLGAAMGIRQASFSTFEGTTS